MNQPADCTVLIAAVDLLPVLQERTQTPGAETECLGFADTDALRALDVIKERRPRVVALEKDFAATHRGAALIERLKADPALTRLEIRIVSTGVEAAPGVAPAVVSPVVDAPTSSLDYRGTRRALRYKMAEALMADVNGNAATLVDLSTIGAQVVSATILKPNQRVRVTFSDERGQVRCQAVVAWASFEMPSDSSPHYRAGLQFLNPNTEVLDAFRVRHQRR